MIKFNSSMTYLRKKKKLDFLVDAQVFYPAWIFFWVRAVVNEELEIILLRFNFSFQKM